MRKGASRLAVGFVEEYAPEEGRLVIRTEPASDYGYLVLPEFSTETTGGRPCPPLEEEGPVHIILDRPGGVEEPIKMKYIFVFEPVEGEFLVCKPDSTELEPVKDADLEL